MQFNFKRQIYSFLFVLITILQVKPLTAAEIKVTPQVGTIKVLFAATSFNDLAFDSPFISQERLNIFQRTLGSEDYNRFISSLTNGIDQSDPMDKLRKHAIKLQEYIKEVSYGKLELEYEIMPLDIPLMASDYNNECASLLETIDEFEDLIDKNKYDKVVYLSPTLKCNDISGRVKFVGGKSVFIKTTHLMDRIPLGTIVHEFGHALGLEHTQTMSCPEVNLAKDCITDIYGSILDVMGNSKLGNLGHFSSFHKEKIGWLSSNSEHKIVEAKTNGDYVLTPLSSQAIGLKGIKLNFSHPVTSEKYWIYIEYRSDLGFDSYQRSLYSKVGGGVILSLIKVDPLEPRKYSSFQLDMTKDLADTSMFSSADLKIGEEFSEFNISIRFLNVNDRGQAVLSIENAN